MTVIESPTGECEVTFPQSLIGCVPTASIGLNTADTFVAGSVAAAPSDTLDPDVIAVTTFNTTGTVTANAFDLIVTCPVS